MEKIYQVIDKVNKEHDYNISVQDINKGTLYGLYRSMSSNWTEGCRGEKVMEILDDGNGYISKLSKNLDYSQGVELLILLTFMNHNDNRCKYDILESKIIMSL